MLSRRAAATIALVVVGSLLLAPTSEAATRTRTYNYVAADFYVVGPDLAADTLRDSTDPDVPALAPLGTIRIVPVRDRLTLTIHDAGITGRIHVTVSRTGARRDLCVVNGRPTVVTGLKTGARTTLTIWGASHLGDRCGVGSLRATAGRATVTL